MRFQTKSGKSTGSMRNMPIERKALWIRIKVDRTEWAANLDNEFSESKKSRPGKKKLPIEQLAVMLEWKAFDRKKECKTGKLKASWTKGENGLNERQLELELSKYSIKRWANHDVWKLMNAGEVQKEGWLKLVRKERNYQAVQA
jgi:hypothetical protein